MVNAGKVHGVKLDSSIKASQTEASAKKYEFFPSTNTAPQDNYTSTADWSTSLDAEFKKLGIGTYTWTPINCVDDAVAKSQDNLIDLLRYYEGHGEHYTAKTNYKDTENISTYGYGLTTTAMKAIGNWDSAKKKVINTPKTQTEAYSQMMRYINDVSKKEVENHLGKDLFNKLPNSIKAALLDYHFKTGMKVMSKSELKTKLQKAVASNSSADWSAVLKELVYEYPSASKEEHVANPGIYRRSLSRVVLAAKGLKKDIPGIDSSVIDKAVTDVYNSAVKCAKDKKIGTADFDRIYNAYTNNAPAKPSIKNTEKGYVVPSEMGYFSAAKAIIPEKTAEKLGIEQHDLIYSVIRKIMDLNNVPYTKDVNGYPEVSLLKAGDTLKMPDSVTINGREIQLNKPANWDEASIENTIPAVPEEQGEYLEAGTYKVQGGEGWWSIARKFAPSDYTEHQKNLLQAYIAEYNNNIELKPDLIIKIPPIDWQGDDSQSAGEDESDIQTPVITTMLNDLPYKSKKTGNLGCFEELSFEYSLKSGDSIYRLALNYNIDYKSILSENGIKEKDASNLGVGTKIKLTKYVYTAQKDETIEEIGEKYGFPKDVLQSANGNITSVKKGEKIEIPVIGYTVKKGDSWGKIASNNSVSAEQLEKLNGKTPKEGYRIIIPISKTKYEKKNADIPAAEINKDIREKLEKSMKEVGSGREYFQPRFNSNGKLIATKHVFEPDPKIKGKLSGKTIIVNAGHGLKADGTLDRGVNKKVLKLNNDTTPDEFQASYDNAMWLKDEFLKMGARVIYLQGDVHLVQDELKDKSNKADLFISLHINSTKNNTKDRTQFWTTTHSAPSTDIRKNSITLSKNLEAKFDEWIPKNEKIAKDDRFMVHEFQDYAQSSKEPLGVCIHAETYQKCPAVLWEVAFMATKKGRERMKDKKLMQNYMKVAAEEIEKFINTPPDTRPKHTVQRGDNLGKIAQKYGTTVTKLQELNGIRGTSIMPGQVLIVGEK